MNAHTQTSGLNGDTSVLGGRGLYKAYGRVVALDGASLEIHRGEIVAVVGDNGAGKSTLLKVLAGVVAPDDGLLEFDGEPVELANAREARIRGIETVHQNLALCDNLKIFQNIYLGREITVGIGPIRLLAKRRMREGSVAALQRLGVDLGDVRFPVTALSGGQRQFVALARAIAWDSRVVLLDEPTAALNVTAAQRVMEVVARLRDHGIGVLLISHDISHVVEVADRIVVMRRGRDIATLKPSAADAATVVGLMTGAIAPDLLGAQPA